MVEFDIRHLFPRFLLADKNGMAMAKAIEAGVRVLLEAVDKGLDLLADVETMPEWRLDEVAWEDNMIYDKTADVETKRQFVRNHLSGGFDIYGTPYSLKQYIKGVNSEAVVQEWFQYGGQPYHFRIQVDGTASSDRVNWSRYVVENVKNTRSVLDTLHYDLATEVSGLHVGMAIINTEKSVIKVLEEGAPEGFILGHPKYGVLGRSKL